MTEEVKSLKAWQKAIELNKEVYALVRELPKNENYALSDQMRRAAVSIPSNIAEGKGRRTDREYIQFLSIARGSCYELETQLVLCEELSLIEKDRNETAISLCEETSRLINGIIRSLN